MPWIVPDAVTADCEKCAEICASDERGDCPIAAENLLHGWASRLADVPEDRRSLPVQKWLWGPFRERRRPHLFSSPFDKLRARALLTPLPRRRHHNLVGSSSKRSLAKSYQLLAAAGCPCWLRSGCRWSLPSRSSLCGHEAGVMALREHFRWDIAKSPQRRRCHPRHDTRRQDRRLWREGRRNAGVRQARQRRGAVRTGRFGGSPDAAGTLEHVHRKVSARAWRSR